MEDLVRRLGVLEELNKAYLQRIEELERESLTPSARASNSRTRWRGVLSTQRENGRFVRDSRYAETMTSSSDLDPRSRGRSLDTPETAVRFRGGDGRGGDDHGGEGRGGGDLRDGGVAAADSAGESVRTRIYVGQGVTGVRSNRSNACHMRMRMHAGQDRTGGCSNRSNITKIIPLHSRNTNITLYYTT